MTRLSVQRLVGSQQHHDFIHPTGIAQPFGVASEARIAAFDNYPFMQRRSHHGRCMPLLTGIYSDLQCL